MSCKWLNKLRECCVGPSGQIAKLTGLQHVLKMLTIQIPDDDATADELSMIARTKVIETKITGIMKSLRKERGTITKRKRDMFKDKQHTVLSFLGNKELLKVMQSWVREGVPWQTRNS